MTLGGDASAALHALLGAIDAGDAPAARGELATLLVAMGQVAAAAGVMGDTMLVQWKKYGQNDPLRLEVVAETPADRIALAEFVRGVRGGDPGRVAVGYSGVGCGGPHGTEYLGPEQVTFIPAAAEEPKA